MSSWSDLYPPAVRAITDTDRSRAYGRTLRQLRTAGGIATTAPACGPAVAAVRELLPRLNRQDRTELLTDLSGDTAGALQRALNRWGNRLPTAVCQLLRSAIRLEQQRTADYRLS